MAADFDNVEQNAHAQVEGVPPLPVKMVVEQNFFSTLDTIDREAKTINQANNPPAESYTPSSQALQNCI